MPTYEYECKQCGVVFDLYQSIKAEPLKRHRCETCGRVRPVQRRIGSGGAVLFKGSGFYTTDYRGDNYKKAAKAETDGAKPAAASEPAKPSGDPPAAKSAPAQNDATSSNTTPKK